MTPAAPGGGLVETPVKRIGLISDTHGLVRPEALAALRGCELVLHAGDIGGPQVLDSLRELAPVIAVRGNTDRGEWARGIAETQEVQLGSAWVHLLHEVDRLAVDPAAAGFQVVVFGHSHRPTVERRKGVLFVNPGSAGPRRFSLPVSVARLEIHSAGVEAEIQLLDGGS
jgi:putative phosphoesterase